MPTKGSRVFQLKLGHALFFTIAVYILAAALTDAHFMGDTVFYVDSVVAYTGGSYYGFWDFGHLLWRPLAWAVFRLFGPCSGLVFGQDARINATRILLFLGWLGGLLCVILLYKLISLLCKGPWVAFLCTVGLIFSNAFLNYSHAGAPYVPGFTMLLLGTYTLVREGNAPSPSLRRALMGGVALAGSACLWFLYVWAIPAVLLLPLVLFGACKRQGRLLLWAAVGFALAISLAYSLVIFGIGIRDMTSLRAWILSSGHGGEIKGFTRVVFGFARSFIDMGNEGVVFKRFLLHDPFNPVSYQQLLRFGLLKLALFYSFLVLVLWALLRSPKGGRILAVLALNGTGLVAFAVQFSGGDIERYLPLYPLLFLTLAWSLSNSKSVGALKIIAPIFIGALMVVAGLTMSRQGLNRRQEKVVARIRGLLPLLKLQSEVAVVSTQDQLARFVRDFPLHPVLQRNLSVFEVLTVNTSRTPEWRQIFASRVLSVWKKGGEVWVSERVFAWRPRQDWDWVEGDDKRVSWPDLPSFFWALQVGNNIGGEDGFVLLLKSTHNVQLLQSIARGATPNSI